MPTRIHAIGVDPGLVHTGIVRLQINIEDRELQVRTAVSLNTGNQQAHARTVKDALRVLQDPIQVHSLFVEAYRPRGNNYGTDAPMRTLMNELRLTLPHAKVIDNTGSRRVVKPALLKLLGLTSFPTTHHQDLEAAARILVYGMLKDDALNEALADIVYARTSTDPYRVVA